MPIFRTVAALIVSGMLLHAAEAAYARAPGKERESTPPSLPPAGLVQGESLRAPSGPALTPDDAAREIQRRHGGRVLAVQPDGAGYRVKMLKDGEVRIYQVNP
ncbi:hypothetical protein [Solimonas soli]|uniref:hypothetical protein n=1 Tax=Solimonas soli TaxID=413479 RepID=UPI0004B4B48E|nr:hypothetical protein [Solimonas soli]